MLTQLLALITAHNYLAIAIVATLYLRTLCGPNSKFPVTVPTSWQPTVTAACGLAYTFESALSNKESVGDAALAALAAAAGSGFLDGLALAIWKGAAAPKWAQAIIFLVDDVAGSKPAAPKGPSVVAVAALLVLAGGLALAPATTGCGLLQKDPNFPTDVVQVEECLYGQISNGQTSIQAMATACGGITLQLAVDLVEAALAGKDPNHSIPAASVPALQDELVKAKAILSAQKAKASLDSIDENRAVAERLLDLAGATGASQ